MKKIYGLLCLLLGMSSLSFAQKSEFGFVLKAGSYGIPIHKKPQETYFVGDFYTTSQGLGSNYTLGLTYSYPLNPQLRIGTEFLYRRLTSNYTSEHQFSIWDGTSTSFSGSKTNKKVLESSLSLPIFLQYKPKKALKWSFIAGLGASRAFSADVQNSFSVFGVNLPSTTFFSTERYDQNEFLFNLNFNTEIAYQLDKSTSIGLAFTHEKQNEPNFTRLIVFNPILPGCFCLFNTDTFRGNLNSFSVSLRHNILH